MNIFGQYYKRKPIKRELRLAVYKRDNFTCQYCGFHASEQELQIDHIIPVSRGGTNDIDNLVTSCARCNKKKGARLPQDSALSHEQLAERVKFRVECEYELNLGVMIGERIKSLREELGQSQEELAHSVGMHPNTIARWERGELVPRGTSLAKLARSLNTTVSYVLEGDDAPVDTGQENMVNNTKSATPRMRKEHSLEENRGMVVYKANGQEIEIPATRDFYKLFEMIIQGMKSGAASDEALTIIKEKDNRPLLKTTLNPA